MFVISLSSLATSSAMKVAEIRRHVTIVGWVGGGQGDGRGGGEVGVLDMMKAI